MTAEAALTARIDQAANKLIVEFRDLASEEKVRALVMESGASLREARIYDFVPLIIERYVREQLNGGSTHVKEGLAGV